VHTGVYVQYPDHLPWRTTAAAADCLSLQLIRDRVLLSLQLGAVTVKPGEGKKKTPFPAQSACLANTPGREAPGLPKEPNRRCGFVELPSISATRPPGAFGEGTATAGLRARRAFAARRVEKSHFPDAVGYQLSGPRGSLRRWGRRVETNAHCARAVRAGVHEMHKRVPACLLLQERGRRIPLSFVTVSLSLSLYPVRSYPYLVHPFPLDLGDGPPRLPLRSRSFTHCFACVGRRQRKVEADRSGRLPFPHGLRPRLCPLMTTSTVPRAPWCWCLGVARSGPPGVELEMGAVPTLWWPGEVFPPFFEQANRLSFQQLLSSLPGRTNKGNCPDFPSLPLCPIRDSIVPGAPSSPSPV